MSLDFNDTTCRVPLSRMGHLERENRGGLIVKGSTGPTNFVKIDFNKLWGYFEKYTLSLIQFCKISHVK